MTDPVAGYVMDGHERPLDMMYSSRPASLWTYWGDFHDPESGIEKYQITVDVNDEVGFTVFMVLYCGTTFCLVLLSCILFNNACVL